MRTFLVFFLSFIFMLETIFAGEAPSPGVIYPNPVIPLPKSQDGVNLRKGGVKMPTFTEEQKKCLVSFAATKGTHSCKEDLATSFATKKISIRPACCSVLNGLKESCRKPVFFQDSAFAEQVSKHCASGGTAPAPESGFESKGGYGDGSFSDTTGVVAQGLPDGPSSFEFLDAASGPRPTEEPSSYGFSGGAGGPISEAPSQSHA